MPNPLRAAPDVRFRATNDGAVLLDVARGAFYGLNPVAVRAWVTLADGGSIDDAVHAVLTEFDIQEDAARNDVVELVAELRQRGLLTDRP